MSRVTHEQLQTIKATQDDSTAFIAAANTLVDRVAAAASFTDDELYQIELWLAAHIASVVTPEILEEKFEGWAVKFQKGVPGFGVLSTNYGVTANTLARGLLTVGDKSDALAVFG